MSDCRDATMPLYLELGDNDGGIQGVDVNGQPLTPDAAGRVNVPVPTKTSELENDSDYQTSEEVKASLETLAEDLRGEMPTRTSELQNDSGYQTAEEARAIAKAEAEAVETETVSLQVNGTFTIPAVGSSAPLAVQFDLPDGYEKWRIVGVSMFEIRDSSNARVYAAICQAFTMNNKATVKVSFMGVTGTAHTATQISIAAAIAPRKMA